MKLTQVLDLFDKVAQKNQLSQLYICGGTPRDKYMGRISEIVDIDLTTGDSDIFKLVKLIAAALPGSNLKVMEDGHGQIVFKGMKFDFSSNFTSPKVEEMLKLVKIEQPTEMQKEMFSRDFTCNALLLTLDLQKILDPTGLGLQDINRKLLRTCLPAHITLAENVKRIPRIIYLATKLNFQVDSEIIQWVANNPEAITGAKPKYIAKNLYKATDYNLDYTVKLLDQMKLWPYIPTISPLTPHLLSRLP